LPSESLSVHHQTMAANCEHSAMAERRLLKAVLIHVTPRQG
jgi:hypothetical protein